MKNYILFFTVSLFVSISNLIADPNIGPMIGRGYDANGYTILQPSSDSRMIYVSSSVGNDANDGLSQNTPKRTVAAGMALLRNGYPDWILFRRGDTFQGSTVIGFNFSGRSAADPMVFTSYGTGARPLFIQNSLDGIGVWGSEHRDNLAIVSVHLRNSTESTSSDHTGINIINIGTGVLIEDCKVEGFSNNIIVDGFGGVRTNTRIRRNVLLDSGRFGNAQNGGTSIYTAHYDGVLIEDNVMDHPLTRENGNTSDPLNRYTSHHLYIGENNPGNNIIRGNIAFNGGRTNYNQRSGGLIENNLSLRGAQGITSGISYSLGEVTATVRNNVILESRDNQSGQQLGFGVSFERMSSLDLDSNIIAHSTNGHDHKAMNLESSLRNANIHHNIVYNWQTIPSYGYNTVKIGSNGTGIVGPVNFSNNIFYQNNDSRMMSVESNYMPSGVTYSNNRYFSLRALTNWFNVWDSVGDRTLAQWRTWLESTANSTPISFPAPSRNVQTYMASLGISNTSTSNFMYEASRMSKDFFRPQFTAAAFNDYIREGFGMEGSGGGGGGGGGGLPTIEEPAVIRSTVDLVASQSTIEERTGMATIVLRRLGGDITQSLTVFVNVGGSASREQDYQLLHLDGSPFQGSITFDPNETIVSFYLTSLDDSLVEGPETASFTVVASPAYDVFGNGATVTIADDDANPQTLIVPTLQSTTRVASGISVVWTNTSSAATGYRIQRMKKLSGSNYAVDAVIDVSGSATTSYVDHPGVGMYRYSVSAVNSSDSTPYSNVLSVRMR